MYIGIDGGGTSCKALLQDVSGKIISEGHGGPANPVNGVAQAQQSILEACYQALDIAKIDRDQLKHIHVGAGIAGLHLQPMQAVMSAWRHPFKTLTLTTDLHAAVMGAHQGNDGAVMILGTGFSALAISGSQQLALGGMGFPVNAMGSGSWLGLEAVKAVFLAEDDLAPATALQALLLKNNEKSALAEQTINGDATLFGSFAPPVFEAAKSGDIVAESLLQQATQFAESVISRLAAFGAPRVALIGTVANALQPRMSEHTKTMICEIKASPQEGAIMLARQAT